MKNRQISKNILLATVAAMTAAWPAMAATSAASPVSQSFVEDASAANQFEINSSEAALRLSQDPDVKKFAQEMIDDHTAAGASMKAAVLEAKNSIVVREPPPGLDAVHQQILDDLKNAPSGQFDKKYIDAQVDAHNKAVQLFSDYSKNGDNDALKDFSAKTLPTLQRHKEHIDALAAADSN
jgi:putative membrane protein